MTHSRSRLVSGFALLLLLFASLAVRGENCKIAEDMDPATRSALTSAGQRYFEYSRAAMLPG